MRSLFPLVAMFVVVACSKADRPEIDVVELRRSGWVSEDVTINSKGFGTYRISEPYPEGQSGTFKMTQEQFVNFLSGLERYRAEAETYTDESAMRFVEAACPPRAPRTTDAGAMYIRWKGPKYDTHFLMDFGCDADRHADRNSRMHRTFERLPLPLH